MQLRHGACMRSTPLVRYPNRRYASAQVECGGATTRTPLCTVHPRPRSGLRPFVTRQSSGVPVCAPKPGSKRLAIHVGGILVAPATVLRCAWVAATSVPQHRHVTGVATITHWTWHAGPMPRVYTRPHLPDGPPIRLIFRLAVRCDTDIRSAPAGFVYCVGHSGTTGPTGGRRVQRLIQAPDRFRSADERRLVQFWQCVVHFEQGFRSNHNNASSPISREK
jgi:hypothetical protein